MSVGKSIIRVDSFEKLTGQADYVEDLYMSGMLYAKVFRSPVAHGVIRSLDISEAEKSEGVHGVFTAADIPGKNIIPVIFDDQVFLADRKVLYPGQPIAVIAAETPEQAEKAARLIKIDIDELEALVDFEKSRQSNIKIFGDNNIFCTYKVKKGDVDKEIKDTDNIVLRDRFYVQHQEHAYLEPQGALAYWEDNTLTVRGSMQAPFYVQHALSKTMGMKKSRIRVIQQTTGGAFGGKEDVPNIVCSQAALCAYHLRRPVRLVYDREEDMQTMSKRHPAYTDIELVSDKNGNIRAIRGEYVENAGAFATLTPAVLYRGVIHLTGPYDIPSVDVVGEAVATNTVPNGAYRGFGSPQVIFAMESMLDMLAEKIGISPVEIREINLLKPGDKTCTGQKVDDSMGMQEVFRKCMEESDYYGLLKEAELFNKDNPHKKRGVGVSTLYYGVGLGAAGKHMSRASSVVKIDGDGSVNVSVGVTEMGQGLRTVATQMAAEYLGIGPDMVTTTQIDSSRILDTGPTVASRGTITAGWGILSALSKIRKILIKYLEKKYNKKIEDIHFADGRVRFGNHDMEYSDFIAMCTEDKVTLQAAGLHVPPDCTFDENGQGDAYYVYAWGMNVLVTEVNLLTGEVDLKKAICCHDVGKAINPREVKGQIMGGSLQGLGYGLMEDMQISGQGKVLTRNFSTYAIPTSCDYPEWKAVFVESEYSKGPYGAKGFGEQPLMGMAPALTNSIYNACGARLKKIPAIPERVLEVLWEDEK